MINNTSDWRLEYVVAIAILFKVDIEWLLFGTAKYMIDQLAQENKQLKEEVEMLKDKVASYEVAANKFLEIQAPVTKLKKRLQTKK